MGDFFLAPVLSLFSIKFYQKMLVLPRALGFLYLAYLSFIFAVIAGVVFRIQALPVADDLFFWLSRNLPEIKITRQGLEMAVAKPLLLIHPRWGSLLYLDPDNEFPKSEDLKKALIVVTPKNIAYRDLSTGEYRIQSIAPRLKPNKEWQDFLITGDKVDQFWRTMKPFLSVLLFLFTFAGTYLWKLLAALVYSLVGIFVNMFRTERLPYRSILELTIFTLTPVTLLQIVLMLFSNIPIPMNFFTALLITSIYITVVILGTQQLRFPPTVSIEPPAP